MKCDIIIPIWNQLELTKKCIESIIKFTDFQFKLILIDNASEDKIKEYLLNFKKNSSLDITLISNKENLGWIKAINMGLKYSKSEYVCFQNNDIEVSQDWLGGLVKIADAENDIGIVNPSWEDGKVSKDVRRPYTELDYCRGFCMLVKRAVLDKIGGLDEVFGIGYYDDWDFSLRAIEAGFRCIRANNVRIFHHKEKSFSMKLSRDKWNELFEKNKNIFYKRWGKPLRFFIAFDLKSSEYGIDEIDFFLRRILKRQHKIRLFATSKLNLGIDHSNFKIWTLPKAFFDISVIFDFFGNSKKNLNKKYDVIFLNSSSLFIKLNFLKFNRVYKIYFDNLQKGFSERLIKFLNQNFEKPSEANVV